MNRVRRVIIGPGLSGRVGGIKLLTRNWPKKYGLTPEIVEIVWKDNKGLSLKLQKVLDLIDEFVKRGDQVSLVGCSASGSLMLNAFTKRRYVIHKVVNIGGFLRPGNARGIRSFAVRSKASLAVRESVARFEKSESKLTKGDRIKIMTIRPLFDELVPPETVVINGAHNKTVPILEHVLGISIALVAYDPLIKFLH